MTEPTDFLFGLSPETLATLRPDDPDGLLYEVVCQEMWPAFILWAVKNDEIRKAFTEATGFVLLDAPRSPIEILVDKATGYCEDIMRRFVEWVTVEIYGIECAPALYREEYARRQAQETPR